MPLNQASAPAGPTPADREAGKIRTSHRAMLDEIGTTPVGGEFFSESSERDITLTRKEAGLVAVQYWGGAFSGADSGTYTETYRQYRLDGVDMLDYTRAYSGDAMTCAGASTTSRSIPLQA